MAKQTTFNDFSKGVGETYPYLFAAYGVDLSKYPYISVANQLTVDEDDNDLATMSEVNWFAEHTYSSTNNLYALCDNGNLLVRSSGTWSLKKTLGANHTRGLASFNGNLFVALNDDVDRSTDGGANFTSDWWTGAGGSGLTVQTYHPLTEVRGELLIGDGNLVHTWDGATVSNSALTLPKDYIIIDIIKTPYYAGILANIRGQGRLFLWDTDSALYNYAFTIPNNIVGGIQIQSNTYILDTKGNLYVHDGDRMVVLNKIPDLEKQTATSIIQSKPQCMTLENDELLIAIDMGSVAVGTRALSGVWAYNLKTGALYHKYYISSKEVYQVSLGAIFNFQNSIYLSNTEKVTGDINIDKTGITFSGHTKGAFVILPIFDKQRKKRLVKHIIDYILTSNSANTKITVSYATNAKFIGTSGGSIKQAANTGTANNSFTIGNDYANVGDMVMVQSGARAGDISFVTGQSGSFVYTVSPNFSGALANGDVVAIFEYKKIGTIDGSTDENTVSKLLRNGIVADDYLLRLDFNIASAGDKITIRNISTTYNELKN